ncbi:hypothetical protein TYRP_021009 [Tyrophagus putrescentiae]|nr:hypothetical protein TYRP_021009 [Tyrophagus putrescentiae]
MDHVAHEGSQDPPSRRTTTDLKRGFFQSAPSDPSAPSAPPEASTSAHSNLAYNPDYTPASPPPAYTAASPTAPPLSSPAGHSPNNSNNNNGDSSHYYYNSFQGEPIKPYNPPSLPAASFTENRVAPAAPAAPTPAPALLTHADGSAVSPEEVALALAEVEAERRTAKYKIVKFLKSDNFVFLLIGLATISAIYLILRNNPQFKK